MVKTKVLFITLLLIFLPIIAFNQPDTSIKKQMIIITVESMPEFKGGRNSLIKFINKNIRYPELAKRDSLSGVIYVEFWVDTIGNTYKHKVIKGIRKDLNEEALRVAKLIKFDKPAMQNKKPISVRFVVPIKFKLNKKKPPWSIFNYSRVLKLKSAATTPRFFAFTDLSKIAYF